MITAMAVSSSLCSDGNNNNNNGHNIIPTVYVVGLLEDKYPSLDKAM